MDEDWNDDYIPQYIELQPVRIPLYPVSSNLPDPRLARSTRLQELTDPQHFEAIHDIEDLESVSSDASNDSYDSDDTMEDVVDAAESSFTIIRELDNIRGIINDVKLLKLFVM